MKNPNEVALLIIDMINDFQFDHGPILAKYAKDISFKILSIKREMKRNGIPIIYVNDHFNLLKADLNKIADACKNPLSEGIIDTIFPEDDEYFLIKPHYSGFYDTDLHTLLSNLSIKKLIITGISGNICVLFTANDAYMRGYEIIIPSDCTASNLDEDNIYALKMMRNVLKATITVSGNIKLN